MNENPTIKFDTKRRLTVDRITELLEKEVEELMGE